MAVQFQRSANRGTLSLEGELDIGGAAELKAALLEAFASGMVTGVTVERVTDVDITGMQLLCAAEREARSLGVTMSLDGPMPETVRAAFREAGFERVPLADPLDPGAE